jgi:hypothetical protein
MRALRALLPVATGSPVTSAPAVIADHRNPKRSRTRITRSVPPRSGTRGRGTSMWPAGPPGSASLMSLAADDAGLPDDPEFRSAFVAYVEWGTRLAQHNWQPGAEVIEHAPVPRWGWGEAPPFKP